MINTVHMHTRGWHCSPLQGVGGGVWGGDTLRTYCTEDTPASISHAASISDLSTLSIPGEEPRKERHASGQRPSLNDSGDNSSDNDNLLEQCIQSAMPKVRLSQLLLCLSLLFDIHDAYNSETDPFAWFRRSRSVRGKLTFPHVPGVVILSIKGLTLKLR